MNVEDSYNWVMESLGLKQKRKPLMPEKKVDMAELRKQTKMQMRQDALSLKAEEEKRKLKQEFKELTGRTVEDVAAIPDVLKGGKPKRKSARKAPRKTKQNKKRANKRKTQGKKK